MANTKVFKSGNLAGQKVVNKAGGKAVSLSDKESLAKYAVTCMFTDTYYASGGNPLGVTADVMFSTSPM